MPNLMSKSLICVSSHHSVLPLLALALARSVRSCLSPTSSFRLREHEHSQTGSANKRVAQDHAYCHVQHFLRHSKQCHALRQRCDSQLQQDRSGGVPKYNVQAPQNLQTCEGEHGIVWNAGRSAEHDSTRDLARHVYWCCQFDSVHARGVGKKRYFRLNLSSLSVLHRSVAALSGLDI